MHEMAAARGGGGRDPHPPTPSHRRDRGGFDQANERGAQIRHAEGEASVTPDLAIVSFAVSGEEGEAPSGDEVNVRRSGLAKRRGGTRRGTKHRRRNPPQYDYRTGQR